MQGITIWRIHKIIYYTEWRELQYYGDNRLSLKEKDMDIKQEETRLAVVFPPGDTLDEWLEERDMTVEEFARLCNKPEKEIQMFIAGERRVTLPFAKVLEEATKIPVYMWENHQALYDSYLRRIAKAQEHELKLAD